MKFLKIIGLIAVMGLIVSCGSKLPDDYHIEKKYWDTSDYDAAIRYLKYSLKEEEGYPRLSDPLTSPVFNKLVDKQNVSVVLEDEQLGLKHRNDVAQGFFDAAGDLFKIYQVIDIRDKFVYPLELVRVIDFYLYTQILYFRVGNDKIIKDNVDPDDPDTKRVLKRNEQAIADNFNNYLEFLAKEDAFNDAALLEYANVINVHFHKLIDEFPMANYSTIKNSANLLIKKVKSSDLKKALEGLVKKIDER